MDRIPRFVEHLIRSSRWLVVPLLLGLIVGLAAVVFKFAIKLVEFLFEVYSADLSDVLVSVLKLVDLTLTANLVLIVICSSYDNFVASIGEHPGWPPGLVKIGFSGLKQKLLGSIVAISAVSALEWFMDIDRHPDSVKLGWVVGILLAFAVAMLVLAAADRLSGNDTHR